MPAITTPWTGHSCCPTDSHSLGFLHLPPRLKDVPSLYLLRSTRFSSMSVSTVTGSSVCMKVIFSDASCLSLSLSCKAGPCVLGRRSVI